MGSKGIVYRLRLGCVSIPPTSRCFWAICRLTIDPIAGAPSGECESSWRLVKARDVLSIELPEPLTWSIAGIPKLQNRFDDISITPPLHIRPCPLQRPRAELRCFLKYHLPFAGYTTEPSWERIVLQNQNMHQFFRCSTCTFIMVNKLAPPPVREQPRMIASKLGEELRLMPRERARWGGMLAYAAKHRQFLTGTHQLLTRSIRCAVGSSLTWWASLRCEYSGVRKLWSSLASTARLTSWSTTLLPALTSCPGTSRAGFWLVAFWVLPLVWGYTAHMLAADSCRTHDFS